MKLLKEEQSFPLWVRLFVPCMILICGLIVTPFASHEEHLNVILCFSGIVLFILLMVVYYLLAERMLLKLDKYHLQINYSILPISKKISINSIDSFRIARSKTLSFGWVLTGLYPTEYKVGGQRGIVLRTEEGKELFISSNDPETLFTKLCEVNKRYGQKA